MGQPKGDDMGDTGDHNTEQGAGILSAVREIAARGPAPVHLWNPPYCGEMDMEIRADGTWFHEGTPIGRLALVRLFASVLKLEEGRFYLVTPVEKLGIRVEDAPFVAVDVDISGQGDTDQHGADHDGGGRLIFTTNLGEVIEAGPDHAIRVTIAPDGTPRPYLHVRRGLEALIDRKSFYRLAEAARPDAAGRMSVRARGLSFALEG